MVALTEVWLLGLVSGGLDLVAVGLDDRQPSLCVSLCEHNITQLNARPSTVKMEAKRKIRRRDGRSQCTLRAGQPRTPIE